MRIRIVALENCRTATPLFASLLKGAAKSAATAASGEGGSGGGFPWAAHVRVGLYNGGSALCGDECSSIAGCDEGSNPQWNEWLPTGLSIAHAPQAARACFTVYGRPLLNSSSSKGSATVPLGWASLPLFDHNDVLASGLYSLRLWPGAEANPIGPSMENVSVYGPETPTLYVQFEAFASPLVLPPMDAAPRPANAGMCPRDSNPQAVAQRHPANRQG